jgi:hypothetical protein
MRLIHTFHKSSGVIARVFFSAEYQEFSVHFYVGKEHLVDLDYFTDEREDALYNARIQLSGMDMLAE